MSWRHFELGFEGFGQVLWTEIVGFLKSDGIEEKQKEYEEQQKERMRKRKPKI